MKAFLIKLLAKHGATIAEAIIDELGERLQEREDEKKKRDAVIDQLEKDAEEYFAD